MYVKNSWRKTNEFINCDGVKPNKEKCESERQTSKGFMYFFLYLIGQRVAITRDCESENGNMMLELEDLQQEGKSVSKPLNSLFMQPAQLCDGLFVGL